mgnify:CR=1 FL=1
MKEIQSGNTFLTDKLQKGGKYIIVVDPKNAQEIRIHNPFSQQESESPKTSNVNPNNILEQTQTLVMKMFEYFDKGIDFGLNLGMRISEKVMEKTIDNLVSMQQKASLARLVGEALGAALRGPARGAEKVEIREKQGEAK